MGVKKQSTSFTDADFDSAREIAENSEYPNVSAVVSGALARAEAGGDKARALFEAEMKRRLALPLDRWEAVGELDRLPSDARAHLASRANPGGTSN